MGIAALALLPTAEERVTKCVRVVVRRSVTSSALRAGVVTAGWARGVGEAVNVTVDITVWGGLWWGGCSQPGS